MDMEEAYHWDRKRHFAILSEEVITVTKVYTIGMSDKYVNVRQSGGHYHD
jgi:hypothetical protein